jgi:hypothetical protein
MLLLLGASACLGTLIITKLIRSSSTPIISSTPDSYRAPEMAGDFLPAKAKRTIYPYSIIPGGVNGREELAASIMNDPVVSAHYADFVIRQARVIKAEEAKLVHVSYRLRNQIFWTAKTVRLPKGETLITDGQEVARTRCGNKVSISPQAPVSEEEPPIETLETPLVAKVDTIELETFVDTGWEPREISPMAPFIPIQGPALLNPYVPPAPAAILPRYYHPPSFRLSPRKIIVSEPESVILLICGLTVLLAIRFAQKK